MQRRHAECRHENRIVAGDRVSLQVVDLKFVSVLLEMIYPRSTPLAGSEQRELLMSTSREAFMGQGLSAIVTFKLTLRLRRVGIETKCRSILKVFAAR